VRWIAREVETEGESPYTRQSVFEQVKEVRKGDLYDLYAFILARVVPDDAKEKDKVGCEMVLGTLAVLQPPQTIATITSLLPIGDTYNVLQFFRRISSVIVNGLEAVDSQTTPRPHKSFFDWICSNHPESRFRINVKTHHERMSMRCLEILKMSLHFNMADLATSDPLVLLGNFGIDSDSPNFWDSWDAKGLLWSQIDSSVVYSCNTLFSHIAAAGQLCSVVLDGLPLFFKHLFLSWTEVACTSRGRFESDSYLNEMESVHTLITVCVGFLLKITVYILSVARMKTIMNCNALFVMLNPSYQRFVWPSPGILHTSTSLRYRSLHQSRSFRRTSDRSFLVCCTSM
jgi:hypothetical protein